MNNCIEPTIQEPPAAIHAGKCLPLVQKYESVAERYSFRDGCRFDSGEPSETPPVDESATVPEDEKEKEEPKSYGAKWPQMKNILLPDEDQPEDK
ncbi:hypothetical protein D3C76_599760 [compost metagenome]